MTDEAKSAAAPKNTRSLLGLGALAAIVAGGLAATASTIESVRGDLPGFGPATVLMLLGLIPQAVVIVAFVRTINAVDRLGLNSLRRSAICVYVLVTLLTIAAAIVDIIPEPESRALAASLLVAGLGCVILLAYAVKTGALTLLLLP